MTDPTLIGSSETTWAGWSVTKLMENVLSSRGLTLDSSSTGRVAASTAEQNECRDRVHRALGDLNVKWPSTWFKRTYTVTWTSGDHSIALPQNCAVVNFVWYGGVPQIPLADEDYVRFVRSDSQGGGVKSSSVQAGYYRITGVTEVTGGTPDPYYQRVLRLFPTPSSGFDTDTLVVEYLARAPDMASADDANVMELDDSFVQWVAERAKEIWGLDAGDTGLVERAMAAKERIEETIFLRLEGTTEFPDRVRWGYPVLPEERRGSA